MGAFDAAVVVPAIPPRPPQVTLLGSALTPDDSGNDPSTSTPTDEQLAGLPAEVRAELAERQGEMWVRGFTYAPEAHGAAAPRDRCDFTSIDAPAVSAPAAPTLAAVAGGTLVAGSYKYELTYLNANGETTPGPSATLVTGSTGSVKLTWAQPDGFYGQVRIYGRISGSLGLLATVGPFDEDQAATWTDTGAAGVGAVPPVSNTTAGPGTYANLAPNLVVPYLIVTDDHCSSFGWSERDFKGRAARWCENATPQAVEREFWTGALAQAKGYPNNYLTNAGSVTDLTPGGGPPSVARGLQILQDALAQCGFGGQGMIHTMAQTAPNLLSARRVGKMLLDVFDNIVVPGVGYPGTAPGGATPAAGTTWMYATDLVMVRTEDEPTVIPETFAESIDWGQGGQPNTITFRAQRFGVAYFDAACHFGCRVTLAT